MRLLLLLLASTLQAEVLEIDKGIYQVTYDTNLEQPLKVSYALGRANTVKAADRKGMNFKKEPGVHTSDDKDYYKNVWDKGHMVPAGSFSNNEENLKLTFSYLNSALQHEKLNRGAWKQLEAAVRGWAEYEKLHVVNEIWFSPTSIKLPTGATVPDGFMKIIHALEWEKCFFFVNEAPTETWENYEVPCNVEGIRG
jgi:endonuclease G